jgi:ATP-dependent DNA ligase
MEIKMYPDFIYKRTKTGAIQVWKQEVNGSSFRTISGQLDGALITAEWTVCVPKNIGRANSTTPEEQCLSEVSANYTEKLKRGYYNTISEIDNTRAFFEPMLAYPWADKFDPKSGPWYCQPKLDGLRMLLTDGRAQSRTGKDDFKTVPHILETLSWVFEAYPSIVLDGEIYNHELHDDFNSIISLAKKKKPTIAELQKSEILLQYHIYDVFDKNRPELTFAERLELLEDISSVMDANICVKFVETKLVTTEEELDLLNFKYIGDGYEGEIIRLNKPYEFKRTKSLLKRKEFFDSEFKIIRVEEGIGNRSGMAGRIVCLLDDGTETAFGAGIKGSWEYATELLKNADSYIGGEVTVKYPQRTPDGIPRFPVAIALYQGKRNI